MSEPATPTEANASETTLSEPVEPPSSGPPAGVAAEPQRYEDPSLPSWAQGKTFEEIVRLTEAIANNQSPQPSTPTPSQAAPMTYPQGGALTPPDPQLMYTDPAAYQRQYEAYSEARIQAQMAQMASPFAARQAELEKSESKRDPRFASVWQRWEVEIERELMGIPPESRNRALYDKAASIVKANHMDELLGEEVERRMAAGGVGTERGSSAGGGEPQVQLDELEEAWDSDHPYFAKARSEGLTKNEMREWLRKWKIPVSDFVKNVQSENIISTLGGFQRRPE
jgi:hypothetical protein